MGKSKHDQIAEKIAEKYGVEYNPAKGADIVTSQLVVEVEKDANALGDGIRQLQGYKKSRYLAVPKEIIDKALKRTQKTKIGVMDEKGRIVKRAKCPGN